MRAKRHRHSTRTGRLFRHAALGSAVGLAVLAAACYSEPPASRGVALDGGGGPPASTTPPGTAAAPAGRALRRLSRREYNNVVRDLLGDTSRPADHFGTEVYVNGFDNGSDGLTVQGTDLLTYQSAAEALAATAVTSNRSLLIGSCDPTTSATACVAAFLSGFAKRAYRRPLTTTESDRLNALYAVGAAASGFDGGLELMLEGVLQSPAFLYRAELGAADPSLPAAVVRLTDYEVATELSFLITGSMPDDPLLAAADKGALKTPADLAAHVARLLATPSAKPGFRAFLHQWMATDQVSSVNKDATMYPNFTPLVAASMAGELDRYFDAILWTGNGSLRELFTSSESFVDATLASLYRVAAPSGDAGFAQVTLDAKSRKGVMTRAGFLAAHADSDSSGPVPRGVFVLNSILCAPPSPPPPNVPAAPPASVGVEAHETTRQRFEQHLSDPACKSCHTVIDGVGFGFEQFDGIGAYRTTENGSVVDTSGTLVGTDVDGPFLGAGELAGKLAASQQVLGCFIKQVYRFAMGQEETPASKAVLARVGNGFTADARAADIFTALATDSAFVLRSTAQTSH